MPTTTISITITTPTDITIAQLTDTLSTYWGYQSTIVDPVNPNGPRIPNPQTKGQFLKSKIAAYARDSYKSARAAEGESSGRTTAITDADRVTAD